MDGLLPSRNPNSHPGPGAGEEGQTLAEYALILALFAIAMVGALGMFQSALDGYYDRIAAAIGAL